VCVFCVCSCTQQVSGEGNPGAAAAAAGGGPEAGRGLTQQERAGFKAALLKVCVWVGGCVWWIPFLRQELGKKLHT